MLRTGPKQLSLHSLLYNNIPENHILKIINKAINLEFVNNQLESSYCTHYGRPAKELEMMLRIHILKYLYNLSDEQLVQDLNVNLAYKWFIGLNPEEPLPESSLLTKFRTLRLKDISMEEIDQAKQETAEEVVQAVKEAQDILKSDLFIEQKGIRSLVDKEARVGHMGTRPTFALTS